MGTQIRPQRRRAILEHPAVTFLKSARPAFSKYSSQGERRPAAIGRWFRFNPVRIQRHEVASRRFGSFENNCAAQSQLTTIRGLPARKEELVVVRVAVLLFGP
jgi:hypothetical protein